MVKKGEEVPNMGFGKMLEDIKRTRASAEKIRLTDAVNVTIPNEDLLHVREIKRTLSDLVEKHGQGALPFIESYLRGLSCWKYIFTTGVGKERSGEKDSLYFVMPSGISLRLKRSELARGIKKVVQPFMELICFEDENYNVVSFEPKSELTTREYLTRDLYDFQQGTREIGGNLHSRITIGKRADTGQLVVIDPGDFRSHNGSPVNYIEQG